MKKMKATLAIAMASVLTIGLVGCGSSSAPGVTEPRHRYDSFS